MVTPETRSGRLPGSIPRGSRAATRSRAPRDPVGDFDREIRFPPLRRTARPRAASPLGRPRASRGASPRASYARLEWGNPSGETHPICARPTARPRRSSGPTKRTSRGAGAAGTGCAAARADAGRKDARGKPCRRLETRVTRARAASPRRRGAETRPHVPARGGVKGNDNPIPPSASEVPRRRPKLQTVVGCANRGSLARKASKPLSAARRRDDAPRDSTRDARGGP